MKFTSKRPPPPTPPANRSPLRKLSKRPSEDGGRARPAMRPGGFAAAAAHAFVAEALAAGEGEPPGRLGAPPPRPPCAPGRRPDVRASLLKGRGPTTRIGNGSPVLVVGMRATLLLLVQGGLLFFIFVSSPAALAIAPSSVIGFCWFVRSLCRCNRPTHALVRSAYVLVVVYARRHVIHAGNPC